MENDPGSIAFFFQYKKRENPIFLNTFLSLLILLFLLHEDRSCLLYTSEWRVADKHKMTCFEDVDYFIDTNNDEDVKMVSGEGVRDGLRQIASQPFRTCLLYTSLLC